MAASARAISPHQYEARPKEATSANNALVEEAERAAERLGKAAAATMGGGTSRAGSVVETVGRGGGADGKEGEGTNNGANDAEGDGTNEPAASLGDARGDRHVESLGSQARFRL